MINSLLALLIPMALSDEPMGKLDDGDSSDQISNLRVVHTKMYFDRKVELLISDHYNVGVGRISSGKPEDEVYIDRSYDGGRSWEGRIGHIDVPPNSTSVQTVVFNLDNLFEKKFGVVRACGYIRKEYPNLVACSPWFRSSIHANSSAEAAATTLMMYYNNSGKWDLMSWKGCAIAVTSINEYMNVTGDRTYLYAIENTFKKIGNNSDVDFGSRDLDETGFWGLAWLSAYDLTGDQKYLQASQAALQFMHKYIDDQCGGGVYRNMTKDSKTAITNELFIKLAAALHNRIPGDTTFLQWAMEVWLWFDRSGMIIKENLVNDGLDSMGTQNQGVILGALVELNKASGEKYYLDRARAIADAMTHSNYFNQNGILHEPCDHNGKTCGFDSPNFKGLFASNLGKLNVVLEDHPYSTYIYLNADMIPKHRSTMNEYGLHYEGPFEHFTPASQQSALSMLVAQERFIRAK